MRSMVYSTNRRHECRRSSLRGCATKLALVVIGGLVSMSCISTKPIQYYTIEPAAPAPANQAKPDGLILLVGNITASEALQDGRIRFRSGSNESGAYEYHRWTERPSSLVRDSLVRALRASRSEERRVGKEC